MTHASLFSGIGGFDLAAEWMGWTNLFNCEWEEFPRQVLKHHFPNATQYGDIKELDATAYAGRVDILTGGFPCQPYALAGKRKGKDDERHLWPEMLRVVRECSPRWVVGENVRGLVGWNGGLVFEEVCADLEACGYSVQPFVFPAAGVGAPHRRDRVWFVAHTISAGARNTCGEIGDKGRTSGEDRGESLRQTHGAVVSGGTSATGANGLAPNAHDKGGGDGHGQVQRANGEVRQRNDLAGPCHPNTWEGFPTVRPFCGGDDGLPRVLDGITFSNWRRKSMKAYGNAIVPQVALQIFKAIEQYEHGA